MQSAGSTFTIPRLMYADDVVLLSDSPQQLQRMLERSLSTLSAGGSRTVSKSAVVVAGTYNCAAKRDADSNAWTLSGSRLPVAAHYTYLGLEFGLLGPGRWVALASVGTQPLPRGVVGQRQPPRAARQASGPAVERTVPPSA